MIFSKDLTVGNTVTVSVTLYKNQWKKYLKLSAIAHLWLLIPIYGWARHFAIAAWISHLSLQELSNDLNSNSQTRYFSFRSLWILFFTAIFALVVPFVLGLLIFFCLTFCLIIVIFFLYETVLRSSRSSLSFNLDWIGEDTINLILGYFVIISIYLITIWFYTRLFVTDLVFVVETNKKTFTLIKRSYLLTKNSKFKIFRTIGLSSLVVFPVWLTSYFLLSIFQVFILTAIDNLAPNLLENTSDIYLGLWVLTCWILLVNLLVMPFWQSLKAVLFYQLTQQNNWDLISNHRQD